MVSTLSIDIVDVVAGGGSKVVGVVVEKKSWVVTSSTVEFVAETLEFGRSSNAVALFVLIDVVETVDVVVVVVAVSLSLLVILEVAECSFVAAVVAADDFRVTLSKVSGSLDKTTSLIVVLVVVLVVGLSVE